MQHEFFVAGTPVIAFKTGGLKDTVFEFDPKTKKGNGFNFQEHRYGELLWAVDRAISVYPDAKLYDQLRRNAFDSVIDVADVSRAWDKEFHRLFGKVKLFFVFMTSNCIFLKTKSSLLMVKFVTISTIFWTKLGTPKISRR